MFARAVFPIVRTIRMAATGGIYVAPTNQPIRFASPQNRGRGISRPYRAMYFHRPVGRGVLRLPQNFAMIGNFRQVCRGRIYASRAVCPLGRFTGLAATGGIYAAPTVYPLYCCCRKTARRGQDPSLQYHPKRGFFNKLFVPARRAHLIYYLLSFIFYLQKSPPPGGQRT